MSNNSQLSCTTQSSGSRHEWGTKSWSGLMTRLESSFRWSWSFPCRQNAACRPDEDPRRSSLRPCRLGMSGNHPFSAKSWIRNNLPESKSLLQTVGLLQKLLKFSFRTYHALLLSGIIGARGPVRGGVLLLLQLRLMFFLPPKKLCEHSCNQYMLYQLLPLSASPRCDHQKIAVSLSTALWGTLSKHHLCFVFKIFAEKMHCF